MTAGRSPGVTPAIRTRSAALSRGQGLHRPELRRAPRRRSGCVGTGEDRQQLRRRSACSRRTARGVPGRRGPRRPGRFQRGASCAAGFPRGEPPRDRFPRSRGRATSRRRGAAPTRGSSPRPRGRPRASCPKSKFVAAPAGRGLPCRAQRGKKSAHSAHNFVPSRPPVERQAAGWTGGEGQGGRAHMMVDRTSDPPLPRVRPCAVFREVGMAIRPALVRRRPARTAHPQRNGRPRAARVVGSEARRRAGSPRRGRLISPCGVGAGQRLSCLGRANVIRCRCAFSLLGPVLFGPAVFPAGPRRDGLPLTVQGSSGEIRAFRLGTPFRQ